MKFKAGDIVRDDDGFRRVFGIVGEVVFASGLLMNIHNVKVSHDAYAFFPSDYANWEIVERDGKPYEPEKWKPENSQTYFTPSVWDRSFAIETFWADDSEDITRLERGLVFKTSEEAIAKCKEMLGINE
jgi:hypothetical protein